MQAIEIRKRFDELASLRSNLDATFQQIERYVVPYRGEFFNPMTSEQEVSWRRRQIFDSTAPIAADLLASSIHSNLTSPMVQWFHLRFRDDSLNESLEAVQWLELVEAQIWQALQESDFNMEIAEIYLDVVSFATAILFQEELSDTEWEGMTFTALPIVDCYFEHGADDKVLRVYRRLRYTKLQLQDKFPDHDFSAIADDVDTKHIVVFCVYQRGEVSEVNQRMAPKARPWGYQYILHATSETLDEGGYYQMPAHVVRWKKVSGSRWGHGPAFVCLSDILQLNATVAQITEARAKELDPPMKTTERGVLSDLDLQPGGLTMVTDMDELERLLPPNQHGLFQADLEKERLQQSIRSTFYVDRLELKESPAMTATEVLARLDKQQRQFAPTLGRLQADLLDPLIEWCYDALVRNGVIAAPPEVVGDDFDIEYVGPIPRSMKNEEAQGTSLWLSELTGYGQLLPELLDIPDTDAIARGLGLDRGVPASYMHSEDEVLAIRKQRQQQQAALQQMELLEQGSKAIKNVGGEPGLRAVGQ